MPERPPPVPVEKAGHLYGGQALIEGVMMRGRDIWAVAVRRPDDSIYLESHEIDSVARRHPWLAKPGIRGVIALGQALGIGFKAMNVSASKAQPEGEELSTGNMAVAMTLAITLFVVVFMVAPFILFRWAETEFIGTGPTAKILEGVFRVGLLIAYVAGIGIMKDVRRVYQYHGAEHKTIAAYEHDAPLVPDEVDKFSTLHVRCGTNFLLIIMVLTIILFIFVGSPNYLVAVLSRIIAVPLIASIAYEGLRLGARFENSRPMHIMMVPGLWLQKITTRPPDHAQIEVAIASFSEVLRAEQELTVQEEGVFSDVTLDMSAPGIGIRPSESPATPKPERQSLKHQQ